MSAKAAVVLIGGGTGSADASDCKNITQWDGVSSVEREIGTYTIFLWGLASNWENISIYASCYKWVLQSLHTSLGETVSHPAFQQRLNDHTLQPEKQNRLNTDT